MRPDLALPGPVLWTETIKFTDVLPDDPRRLLITDIGYATEYLGAGADSLVHLGGREKSRDLFAAYDLVLAPGLWVTEADAMRGGFEDERCYRSRIMLRGPLPPGEQRGEVREQGVDAGMVTYAFAKDGDLDDYENYFSHKLAPEQMIWVRNQYGGYGSVHVQTTLGYSDRGIDPALGFVTATTGSGDGDGGYPVVLTFVGDLLVSAETWFAQDGYDFEEDD